MCVFVLYFGMYRYICVCLVSSDVTCCCCVFTHLTRLRCSASPPSITTINNIARFPIHPMRNACGVSRAVDDDDHDIWCGSPLSSRLRPDRSSSLGERNARVDIATVRQSTHTHNTSTMQETVLFTGFDPRLAVSTATLRRQHRIPSDLRS